MKWLGEATLVERSLGSRAGPLLPGGFGKPARPVPVGSPPIRAPLRTRLEPKLRPMLACTAKKLFWDATAREIAPARQFFAVNSQRA